MTLHEAVGLYGLHQVVLALLGLLMFLAALVLSVGIL